MREASQESELFYRIFLDEAPDMAFTIDIRGRFLYVNKAGQKVTGLLLEKLQKSTLQKLVAPEYQEAVNRFLQNDFKTRTLPFLEVEIISTSGKRIPMEINIARIKHKKGEAVELLGIARDITKRKKALDEIDKIYKDVENARSSLRSILDNASNIAIQGFNMKGDAVYCNRFCEKLFGYSEKQIKGKSLNGIIFAESDKSELKKAVKNAIAHLKSSPRMEWTITTKKGETKNMMCHIFPAVFPGQDPIAVALFMDITESYKSKEKINEMLRQMESFSSISADILSIEEEERLFQRICQAVVDISDFERVLISYFTDKPPYREILGHHGIKEADYIRVRKVNMPREKYLKYFEKGIKIGNQSVYIPQSQKNILDQKALIPGDKAYPSRESAWHKDDNVLVAMKDVKGDLIGIISVDNSKTGKIPTEETVRPLEIFANLISEIILKYKLAKKIRESEEKYRELVNNIKIGIFRAMPDGKILDVNPAVVEMFGYPNVVKFLSINKSELYLDPEDNEKFMKELEEKGVVKNREFKLKKEDGEPFWASITSTAIRDISGHIKYYDTVIEDISQRKKLQEEVERLSVTDELTQLFNRRYYNTHLPKEIQTAEKWRSALSLIMIDIDDFKAYNDKYLHLEGDEVLKETARVISQLIRKDIDWAARFGGDEFIIVLPGISSSDAAVVGERIRKLIQSIKFKPRSEIVHKTISLGVAHCYYSEARLTRRKNRIYPTNYEKVSTELTILADRALFKAKNTGRNKLEISKKTLEVSRMI